MAALLHGLPSDVLPGVVNHLPQPVSDAILGGCADDVLTDRLTAAPVGETARLLVRLHARQRQRALDRLRARDVRRYRRLVPVAAFPPGNIGAVADPDFGWVPMDARWTDVAATVRARPPREDKPVVVLDEQDRLAGILDSAWAVRMEPDTTASLCVLPVRPLLCDALAKDVAAAPAWQDWHWLPVVNRENRPVALLNQRRLVAGQAPPAAGQRQMSMPGELADSKLRVCVDLSRLLFDRTAR